MKKIIFLLILLAAITTDSFSQVRQKQKIGLTTLTDQDNEFTIDRQVRFINGAVFPAGASFYSGITLNSASMLMLNGGITGSGFITLATGNINLLSGGYLLNGTNINSLFSNLNSPNSFTRAQNFDTLAVTTDFNLAFNGYPSLQITPEGNWYSDHYDFYTKGVKRLSIDGDSNKIKIYSGDNQISIWNNDGVLDINAPVVSHGGFLVEDMTVRKDLKISGAFSTSLSAVVYDTVYADSGNVFTKTLSSNTNFKIAGLTDGQTITFAVANTTSNYTVEWTALDGLTIYWPDNDVPVQTTGNHVDLYTFQRIGPDVYANYTKNYK